MFAWLCHTRADVPQPFRHLRPGERYFVVWPFVDIIRSAIQSANAGGLVRYAFLPYEDGLTLFLTAPDGQEVQLRLQGRPDAQGSIVDALDTYLSPVEPALPSHHIATTRDSVCLADDADAPHAGATAVDPAADMACSRRRCSRPMRWPMSARTPAVGLLLATCAWLSASRTGRRSSALPK